MSFGTTERRSKYAVHLAKSKSLRHHTRRNWSLHVQVIALDTRKRLGADTRVIHVVDHKSIVRA